MLDSSLLVMTVFRKTAKHAFFVFLFVNVGLKCNDFHVLQSFIIGKYYASSFKCESFEITV